MSRAEHERYMRSGRGKLLSTAVAQCAESFVWKRKGGLDLAGATNQPIPSKTAA